MVLLNVRVRAYERALLFRNGDFYRVAGPGHYRLWKNFTPRTRETVEVYDALQPRFEHRLLPYLVEQETLAKELEVVDLEDDERAIVSIDGRLSEILGPGLHAYWRKPRRVQVERFRITALRFEDPRIESILKLPHAGRFFKAIEVGSNEVVLLSRNGESLTTLGPGRHVFWLGQGDLTWQAVDLREQILDVAGQEIMTQDKVGLRLNLIVTYQVVDPERSVTTTANASQSLYREAQLALRAAVGTRTLDQLLTDKASVGEELRDVLVARAGELGLRVHSVGLRDIVLPGEMRAILNQVVLAERQAQANLIRRREETAAARSQANTAKLLTENPVLARLKELELVQEILAGTKATFVLGARDLTGELRSALGVELDAGPTTNGSQ